MSSDVTKAACVTNLTVRCGGTMRVNSSRFGQVSSSSWYEIAHRKRWMQGRVAPVEIGNASSLRGDQIIQCLGSGLLPTASRIHFGGVPIARHLLVACSDLWPWYPFPESGMLGN